MFETIFGGKKETRAEVKIMYFVGYSKADEARIGKAFKKEDVALVKSSLKHADFKGDKNVFVEFYTLENKVICVGLGENPTELSVQEAGGSLALKLSKYKSASVIVDELKQSKLSAAEIAYNLAFGLELGSYSFDKYFTKKKKEDFFQLERICFEGKFDKKGYDFYKSLASGVRYARDLVNEPANVLTPSYFADDIKRLEYLGLKVEILGKKELAKLGMGLLLGVSQGSVNEPKVAVLQWVGNKKSKDFELALVGKGITFDSGGIDIKPAAGMEEMKGDMAGAAAVVGAMKTAALQKLSKNLVAVVGLVENMPSGSAIRPSDVLTSMSGQTVEIGNTDAEGRLVLADIMWYVQDKFKIKKMIDIATLTGASQNALGKKYASILGNDQKFIDELIVCGVDTAEKLWQMPLDEEHDKMLKSTIADMNNVAVGGAGMSTAAAFLQRFVKKNVKWAHLDIAGLEMFKEGKALTPKGATGFGVRLFNKYLV